MLRSSLALAVLFTAWAMPTAAQTAGGGLFDPATFRGWGAAGIGIGPIGDPSGAVRITLVPDGHVVSFRSATQIRFLSALLGDGEVRMLSDAGVLYGRALEDTRDRFVSVGIGLGALTERIGFDDDAETTTRLAVPVEIQIGLRPTRYVGLDLYGFLTTDGRRVLGSAAVGFQYGDLRPRRLVPPPGELDVAE